MLCLTHEIPDTLTGGGATAPGLTYDLPSGLLIDIGLDYHLSNVIANGQPHGHRILHEAEIGLPAFELEPDCVLRPLLDFRVD